MHPNVRTHLPLRGFLVLLVLSAVLVAAALPAMAVSSHLAMGNPSNAATDTSNYLLDRPYYALAYSNSTGTPNWVSWRLTEADIGKAPRASSYKSDKTLPRELTQVKPADYTGSGFDKGHMCPAEDRSATAAMGRTTFVMSNMVPQAPILNQQTWRHLEAYCQALAKQGQVLYIVSGPWGKGGSGDHGRRNSIGRSTKVTVPAKCWKVIMALGRGVGDDPKKVGSRARLIAVIMPNTNDVGLDWSKYRVSVAKVEQLTGYAFFDRVPVSVIGPLKQKVDTVPIAAPAAGKSHHAAKPKRK